MMPPFTDAGLRALAACTSLDLSGCSQVGLTAAGLRHLGSCQQLCLWACADGLCGEGGAAGLGAAMPALQVVDGVYPPWQRARGQGSGPGAASGGSRRILVRHDRGGTGQVELDAWVDTTSELKNCNLGQSLRFNDDNAPLLVWAPRWTPPGIMAEVLQKGPGSTILHVFGLCQREKVALGRHARVVNELGHFLCHCGVVEGAVLGLRQHGCNSGSGGNFSAMTVHTAVGKDSSSSSQP
jgi:hypothetical protein